MRVDTQDRSGPALAPGQPDQSVADADIYHYQDEGVEELIAQIIASHQH